MAAFVLLDMCDSYHLWALSPTIINSIAQVDLDRVVRNCTNADELKRLLNVVESMSFTAWPSTWRARELHDSPNTGWQGAGADWMYSNPWKGPATGRDGARELSNQGRHLSNRHPVQWTFDAIPNGWTAPLSEPPQGVRDNGASDGDLPEEDSLEGRVGNEAAMPIATPNPAGNGASRLRGNAGESGNSSPNVEAVRTFLQEAGDIAKTHFYETYDMLIGYLRGRLNP